MRSSRGFTLVELMVAIAITGLILSLAYSLYFFATRSYGTSTTQSELQQQVRLATEFIVKELRVADPVSPGSARVVYTKPGQTGSRTIELNEQSIRLIDENAHVTKLTDGTITELVFEDIIDRVLTFTVVTDLGDSGASYRLSRSVFLLNHTHDISAFSRFIRDESVFVYGSTLSLLGSADAFSDGGVGTLVIDNSNSSDLVFAGNSIVSLQNIFIDKDGNLVIFNSSTKLGQTSVTDLINIRANVELNNGGAEINGAEIYIDGNVAFNNSAKIYGEQIRINGDVTLSNASAELSGGDIFIDGNVIVPVNGGSILASGSINITGSLLFDARNASIAGDTIQVMGGVQLHNGTVIDATSVYVEGDVHMKPQSQILSETDLYVVGQTQTEWEAVIANAGTSFFRGNVAIEGNGALMQGGTIHVDGDVLVGATANIFGELSYTGVLIGSPSASIISPVPFPSMPELPVFPTVPAQPDFGMPSLRPDEWYNARGYAFVTTGGLDNGKVFSQGDYFYTGWNSYNDVIIVSTGDITIEGTTGITGVLVAPNGRVRFNGDSTNPFRGVVIARDGFEVTGLGTDVFFENIINYIPDFEDFPFE